MELERPIQRESDESPRTSLRIRYEAEAEVLRRHLISLEHVRLNLGLSRRKMAQKLLVDPSAWTRWTKDESKVPPHIWKLLHFTVNKEGVVADLNGVLLAPLEKDIKKLQTENRLLKRLILGTLLISCGGLLSLLALLT